jgi:hypothetical protein
MPSRATCAASSTSAPAARVSPRPDAKIARSIGARASSASSAAIAAAMSVRSSLRISATAPAERQIAAVRSSRAASRPHSSTVRPGAAYCRASAVPSLPDAPVIRTRFIPSQSLFDYNS